MADSIKETSAATPDRLKNVRKSNRSKTEASAERNLKRLLADMPEPNRTALTKYVRAKKSEGVKVRSYVNYAADLTHLSAATAGTPFEDISPDALQGALEQYAATHSPATTSHWASTLRAYYRWLNDDELPRPIARALKRRHGKFLKDVQILSEEEFRALLEAAAEGRQRGAAARRCALLWVLWDSGFRISEALALRVGDVLFSKDGGADFRLPPDARGLKTGPRTCHVIECVGALRVWLELHPAGMDAEAPLFPSHRDPANTLWPCNINALLNRLTKEAGLRHINPHLFRHTRATRAAAAGWNEAGDAGLFRVEPWKRDARPLHPPVQAEHGGPGSPGCGRGRVGKPHRPHHDGRRL